MKNSIRHALAWLSLLGLLAAGVEASAAELIRPPPTTYTTQTTEAMRKIAGQSHVVKSNKVSVNLDAGLATVITVTVPGGKAFTLRKSKEIRHDPGNYTWVGSVDGEPLGKAVLGFANGRMIGNVSLPGYVYSIVPVDTAGSAYVVNLSDLSKYPKDRPLVLSPTSPDASTRTAAAAGAPSDGVIDVLFVYTDAAYATLAPTSYLANNGQYIIDKANLTYEDHGFPFRLRSVGMVKAAFTEVQTASGFQGALPQLRARADVEKIRNEKGADIVVLIAVDNGFTACGIAPLPSRADFAHAIADHRCLDGTAFLHEIGHLMGSSHDEETGPLDPSYGYGYRSRGKLVNGVLDPSTCFNTIMADWTQCADNRTTTTSLFQFSNPGRSIRGVPLGSATANNNSFFRTKWQALAAYRTPPLVSPGGASDTTKRTLPPVLQFLLE